MHLLSVGTADKREGWHLTNVENDAVRVASAQHVLLPRVSIALQLTPWGQLLLWDSYIDKAIASCWQASPQIAMRRNHHDHALSKTLPSVC